MFSCEFREISKNTFFIEHLRTTVSAFSFSEATTGGIFTGKHLRFTKFSGTAFLQNTSATATLLKWGSANSVWKTSDEYSLSRNTNLRSTVQLYHFFLGIINFQCMFLLVYTVYCQKQPPE